MFGSACLAGLTMIGNPCPKSNKVNVQVIPLTSGPEKRYAKALFELVEEDGQTTAMQTAANVLLEAFESNPDVQDALANPLTNRNEKQAVLLGLAKQTQAPAVFNRFIKVLVANGRAELMQGVLFWFNTLADAAGGRVCARVEVAKPLSETQQKEIESFIKKQVPTAKAVLLEEVTNPAVLGGVKVTVGSTQFDATLAGRMAGLRRAMQQSV